MVKTANSGKNAVRLREFERSLPMALLQAREAVMNRFRPMLRQNGVTEQQWRVLRALDGADDTSGIDAGDLARACVLLTPSLTRIIRKLEAANLINRRHDAQDRRRIRLAITAKGRALIARVAPYSEAQYADITQRLGADNLNKLYRQLAEVVDNLAD